MTAHQIFKMQVKGVYENLRTGEDTEYVPPHLGGPYGQREVINEHVVLNVTEFEGDS